MSKERKTSHIIKSKSMVLFFFFLTFSFSSAQIGKRAIPDKLVVLIFDDAPLSHYSIVAPLLKKYGFKATFFVCEFPPNFHDNSKYMNWQQIKKLDRIGFEIGNHTQSHAHVNKLSRKNFIRQLQYIEKKCDSLKIKKPLSFAYPGYDYSLNAIATLQEQGYVLARAGSSIAYNPLEDHPFLIPGWATNKDQIIAAFQIAIDTSKKYKN